ncbi:MAG: carboxypeptidase-like regulatory domain-containing protein [Planctomycetota bacterium]
MKRKILIPLSFAFTIIAVVLFLLLRAPQNEGYGPEDPRPPARAAGSEDGTDPAKKDPVAEADPAAGASEEEAEEEAVGTGEPLLTGRVVGEGEGIAGASVRLYSTGEIEVLMRRVERIVPQGGQMPNIPRLIDALRGELDRFRTLGTVVTTDEDGYFELLEGKPGGYFLLTLADGWIFKYGDVVSIDPERNSEITIELERGSRISGRVVSTSGLGIPGATVVAEYRPPGVPGIGKIVRRVLRMVNGEFLKGPFETVTAEDGSFALNSLPSGLYDLAASRVAGVETRLELVQSGTDGAVVVLGGPASLQGFLVDDEDLPVGGVTVNLEPIEDRISLPPMAAGFGDLANTFNHYLGYTPDKTISKPDGTFTYRQLGAGKYRLSIEQPGLLPTVKEATVDWEQNLSIGLVRVSRGKTISGTVRTEDGLPIEGASIIAAPESSNFLTMGSMMNDFATGRLQVESGPDGAFKIQGLRRKRYKVSVTRSGYSPASKKNILAGNGEPVELVLGPGFAVKGRVLLAGEDKPLAGVSVEARGVRTTTDEEGYFLLEGVVQRDPNGEGFNPFGGEGGGGPFGRRSRQEAEDGEDAAEEEEEPVDSDFSVTARLKGYAANRVEILFGDIPDLVKIELNKAPAITGVVYDPEGNPAPASLVRLTFPFPRELESMGFFDTSMIFLAVTVSDRNGRFTFSDFSNPSRDGISEFRVIADNVAYARGYSETFTFSADFDPDDLVEVQLEAGGEIKGLVTSGGQPVAGATLRLRRFREQSQQEKMFMGMLGLPKGGEEARSNSKGEYVYRNVGIGQYSLSAEVAGFKESPEESVAIDGGDEHTVDFDLDPGGSIAGTVVDVAGAAVAGARVRLLKMDNQSEGFRRAQKYFGGSYKSTVAEDDGSFIIDGLPEGSYAVVGEKGGYRKGELEGVGPGDDGIRIVLVLSAALVGRVTDQATGAPLTSFRLGMKNEDSENRFPWGGTREVNDPDGRFKREDLDPGRYEVKLEAPGYVPFTTNLVIAQGERLEQNFSLVRAGRLGGVVVDQATGAPLAGAYVKLVADQVREVGSTQPQEKKGVPRVGETAEADVVDEAQEREEDTRAMFDYYSNRNLGGARKTAADGSFLVDTVPSGPQRVLISHPDYIQLERGGVEVPLGDAVEMEFALSAGIEISGQVVDEAGAPRAGIVVFIRGGANENRYVRKADTSNADGRFRIAGIAAGRYRLLAFVRGGGARSGVQLLNLERSRDDLELIMSGSGG